MALKNVAEGSIANANLSSIVFKQDMINGLNNTLSAWKTNASTGAPTPLNSWATGISFYQAQYQTYYIWEATFKMHVVNQNNYELCLLGYPSNYELDATHLITYGVGSGQVDPRELPGARRVVIAPAGSGHNSATLTMRLKTKVVVGNKSTYNDTWWAAFNPLGNPTQKAYVNWLLYPTGNYNALTTGTNMTYQFREEVTYKMRLFDRYDVKNVNPTVSTVAHPEGETLAPDA